MTRCELKWLDDEQMDERAAGVQHTSSPTWSLEWRAKQRQTVNEQRIQTQERRDEEGDMVDVYTSSTTPLPPSMSLPSSSDLARDISRNVSDSPLRKPK